jgi:hypothetical protein
MPANATVLLSSLITCSTLTPRPQLTNRLQATVDQLIGLPAKQVGMCMAPDVIKAARRLRAAVRARPSKYWNIMGMEDPQLGPEAGGVEEEDGEDVPPYHEEYDGEQDGQYDRQYDGQYDGEY